MYSLTLDSNLTELPSYSESVPHNILGNEVFHILDANKDLPGVLVFHEKRLLGVISRDMFFENTGRRFGVEIYLHRPIHLMMTRTCENPLILPATFTISQATNEALKREENSVYEPIVLRMPTGDFRLMNVLTLFVAQNHILMEMHNQRVLTISAGLPLTDEEAAVRFLQYANLPGHVNRLSLTTRHSIICDRCGERIEYSVADIVRSHPMISRGVEIRDMMGNRLYTFYVRHQCGKDIREIPAQHDGSFAFRSMRPSRIVDSYL
jgi:hypothetical protein